MSTNSNIDEILNEVAKGARLDGFHAKVLLAYPNQSDRYMKPAKQAIQQELLKARIDELGLLDKTTKKHIYVESDGYLKDRIADLQAKLKGDDK
jgi:hypothetical protein